MLSSETIQAIIQGGAIGIVVLALLLLGPLLRVIYGARERERQAERSAYGEAARLVAAAQQDALNAYREMASLDRKAFAERNIAMADAVHQQTAQLTVALGGVCRYPARPQLYQPDGDGPGPAYDQGRPSHSA